VSLDVDHIVAVKLWETLPGAQPQADSEDETALGADGLSTTMNALGNCCLLEKSFNIAKGADPLSAFLQRVHEFKPDGGDGTGKLNVANWTMDLGVDAMLVDPTGKPAADVRLEVEARTAKMKEDLKEYLAGTRQRADLWTKGNDKRVSLADDARPTTRD
jgi:hypothetical protein